MTSLGQIGRNALTCILDGVFQNEVLAVSGSSFLLALLLLVDPGGGLDPSGLGSGSESLAFTNASVVDVSTAATIETPRTVVIVGSRIVAIGAPESTTIPEGARVVDASGKFLIPGLWDMHGHLTDCESFALPTK